MKVENQYRRGGRPDAAGEHVRNDEAYTTYFRKKGEPQRRLAADPGQRDSLEDVKLWEARPRRRACPDRAARWNPPKHAGVLRYAKRVIRPFLVLRVYWDKDPKPEKKSAAGGDRKDPNHLDGT